MKEIHLETIDSTNTYAKDHIAEFDQTELTCIIAEEQTKGRGRFHRHWISPKGVNIYATYSFTLPKKTKDLISLSQVMAISIAIVLENHGLNAQIKWPNDIRLSNKKVAGILTETRFHQECVECFVGIGLNVNLEKEDADQIDQPATSLKIETQKNWDRSSLLKKLHEQFQNDLILLKKEGFTPFHKKFQDLLILKGEKIQCYDGEKVWEGTCHSITESGQLNLQLEDGSIHTILSGDIK